VDVEADAIVTAGFKPLHQHAPMRARRCVVQAVSQIQTS
jgi:hypothetical protein